MGEEREELAAEVGDAVQRQFEIRVCPGDDDGEEENARRDGQCAQVDVRREALQPEVGSENKGYVDKRLGKKAVRCYK